MALPRLLWGGRAATSSSSATATRPRSATRSTETAAQVTVTKVARRRSPATSRRCAYVQPVLRTASGLGAGASVGGAALVSRAFFLRCRSLRQRLIALEPRPMGWSLRWPEWTSSNCWSRKRSSRSRDDLRAFMSNVAVVVDEEPPAGLPLLGLYQGVPLTRRTSGYAGVPPDKITIYRGPLERRAAGDPEPAAGRGPPRRRPRDRAPLRDQRRAPASSSTATERASSAATSPSTSACASPLA